MTKPDILARISATIDRIAAEKGVKAAPVAEETMLLGSTLGIDSLDLAAIVVELSEATGKDPFEDGFIEFRTAGELSELYCDANG